MRMLAKDFENRLARTSDLAGFAAQPVGQRWQVGARVVMILTFHFDTTFKGFSVGRNRPKISEHRKMPMEVSTMLEPHGTSSR